MIAKTNGSMVLNGDALKESPAAATAKEFAVIRDPRFRECIHIRSYQKTDREAISRLCCETGFLGKPVDFLFQDRDLFADLFTQPYLNHEAEWGMVAEVEGRVVGYLLGSVSRHFELLQLMCGFCTATRMASRLMTGHYASHPRSKKFIRWLFTSGFREQPKHPRHAAHLHLDIEKDFRGRGIGRRLWMIYEERLRAAGIRQCYGAFFSQPSRRPEAAYVRFGFKVFDRRRTSLFEPEISEPVEVVCMCKNL